MLHLLILAVVHPDGRNARLSAHSVRHGISSVLPVTILMDKVGLTREIIAAVAGLALY